jgi:hypothetical protein
MRGLDLHDGGNMALMDRRGTAPTVAGGDVLHDGFDLRVAKTLGRTGRGSFLA